MDLQYCRPEGSSNKKPFSKKDVSKGNFFQTNFHLVKNRKPFFVFIELVSRIIF